MYEEEEEGAECGYHWVDPETFFSVAKSSELGQGLKQKKVWYFSRVMGKRKNKALGKVEWRRQGNDTTHSLIDRLTTPADHDWTAKAEKMSMQPDGNAVRFRVLPFVAPRRGKKSAAPKRSDIPSLLRSAADQYEKASPDQKSALLSELERKMKKARKDCGDIAYYFPKLFESENFEIGEIVAIVQTLQGRRVCKRVPEGVVASWWSVVANVDGAHAHWPRPFEISSVLCDMGPCVPIVVLGVAGVGLCGVEHQMDDNGFISFGHARFELLSRVEDGDDWTRIWIGGTKSDLEDRLRKMSLEEAVILLQKQRQDPVVLSVQVHGQALVSFIDRQCCKVPSGEELDAISGVNYFLSDSTMGEIRIEAAAGLGKSSFLRQLFWVGNQLGNNLVFLPPVKLANLREAPAQPEDLLRLCFEHKVAELLWRTVREARPVWLFDGLDEVSDASILEWYGQPPDWARRRVVCTRPGTAGARPGACCITLSPFSGQAQMQYFCNRLGADGGKDLLESFEWRPLASILSTPLFCELICTLHEESEDVSGVQSQPELYQLLTKWIMRRDVTRRVATDCADDAVEGNCLIFAEKAFEAMSQGRTWMQLQDDACRASSLVFKSDSIRDRFEFVHQTFLEWFAGMYLEHSVEGVQFPMSWLKNFTALRFAEHFSRARMPMRRRLILACAEELARIVDEQHLQSNRVQKIERLRDASSAWNRLNIVCPDLQDQHVALEALDQYSLIRVDFVRSAIDCERKSFIDFFAQQPWSVSERTQILDHARNRSCEEFCRIAQKFMRDTCASYTLNVFGNHWQADALKELKALESSSVVKVDWNALASASANRSGMEKVVNDMSLEDLIRKNDLDAVRIKLESGLYDDNTALIEAAGCVSSRSMFQLLRKHEMIVQPHMISFSNSNVEEREWLAQTWFQLPGQSVSVHQLRQVLCTCPHLLFLAVEHFPLAMVVDSCLDNPPMMLLDEIWKLLGHLEEEMDEKEHDRLTVLFLSRGLFDRFIELMCGGESDQDDVPTRDHSSEEEEEDSDTECASEEQLSSSEACDSSAAIISPKFIAHNFCLRSVAREEIILCKCLSIFFNKATNVQLAPLIAFELARAGWLFEVVFLLISLVLMRPPDAVAETNVDRIIKNCVRSTLGALSGRLDGFSQGLSLLEPVAAGHAMNVIAWIEKFYVDQPDLACRLNFLVDELYLDGPSIALRLPFPSDDEAQDPLVLVKRFVRPEHSPRLLSAMCGLFGDFRFGNERAFYLIMQWIWQLIEAKEITLHVQQPDIIALLTIVERYPQYLELALCLFLWAQATMQAEWFNSLWHNLLSSRSAVLKFSNGKTLLSAICTCVKWDDSFWQNVLAEKHSPNMIQNLHYPAVVELAKISPWASKHIIYSNAEWLRDALRKKIIDPSEALYSVSSSMIDICLAFGAEPTYRLVAPAPSLEIVKEVVIPAVVTYIRSPLSLLGKIACSAITSRLFGWTNQNLFIASYCADRPAWFSDSIHILQYLESKGARFKMLLHPKAAKTLSQLGQDADDALLDFLAQQKILPPGRD